MVNSTSFAHLMLTLCDMERDLGLNNLTGNEKLVLSAVAILAEKGEGNAHIDDLRAHKLVRDMPMPTLYRALSELIKKQKCVHLGSPRSGLYGLA